MRQPTGTRKPGDQRYVTKAMKWPPALWERLRQRVPERERSAFIRAAVEGALEARSEPTPPEDKAKRVRAARGALAGQGPSADAYCREKQAEIDREDAAHRRRWAAPGE
jgi:hypothetical protein